jgi:hypothetical protein
MNLYPIILLKNDVSKGLFRFDILQQKQKQQQQQDQKPIEQPSMEKISCNHPLPINICIMPFFSPGNDEVLKLSLGTNLCWPRSLERKKKCMLEQEATHHRSSNSLATLSYSPVFFETIAGTWSSVPSTKVRNASRRRKIK